MLLIKGGRLIDPSSGRDELADLVVQNGIIAGVERPGAAAGGEFKEVLDAAGAWVVPGLVDLHVHLREPGFEWKETIETGSKAAALGGYTTICAMPNTRPANDSAEVTRFILTRAKEASAARVLPIGAVSPGLEGKEMSPLSELAEAGCVAFSDDGEPIANAALMRRALEWSRMLGLPVCAHEEDKALSHQGCMNESPLSLRMGLRGWPAVAEEVMIARDIELARVTRGHVHFCHVSTARGALLVKRAKEDGIPVTAEVCPHHLVLTEERVQGFDTNAKMSPPLRTQADCDALIQALSDGVIDIVASDHAPHEKDSKEVEFEKASNGIIGFPTTLPLILGLVRSGKLSRLRAIEALSTGARKLLRSQDVGLLTKGGRADIAIIDPEFGWELDAGSIISKSKNSPFIGQRLQGIARHVLVEGQVIVRNQGLV